MKKKFEPKDWLKSTEEKTINSSATTPQPNNKTNQFANSNDIYVNFDDLLHLIEQKAIDITNGYDNWRNIGFALTDEFGEFGRDFFHRLSKFNSNYDYKTCDDQYNKCLNAKGHGITMGTIFHLANESGFVRKTKENLLDNRAINNNETFENKLPVFHNDVYQNLPLFLRDCVKPATSDDERDVLLLGTLTVLSVCFPTVYGIYDGKKVKSNLYLFITALASAGKGRLTFCKQIVKPIHLEKRQQNALLKKEYEEKLVAYNSEKNKNTKAEKPSKPSEKMLFIPANNSTTGVFELLFGNNGEGLIFETEGDTLTQAFKSDYGNYSDGFRRGFHHENISYYRRTDKEFVEIENPCISTVLSGTPKQITALIPSAENGLFSRFIYYYMNITPVWKNVFEHKSENGLEDHYDKLGQHFLDFYKILKNNPFIQFKLTEEQEQKFSEYFANLQNFYINVQNDEFIATVRRMGIVAFRLMMILSVVRIMEHGAISTKIFCEDDDFDTVIKMVDILIQHSSKVFNELPKQQNSTGTINRKELFFKQLPKNFSTIDYQKIAAELNIPAKTAEGYITSFIKINALLRERNGTYKNLRL